MSPSQVLERSYLTLKRRLIEGTFMVGQRLEAARLSEELHASITPVRDVLNRLTGEGLVQAIAGGGFYVPMPDESDLRNLLAWNVYLAQHALHAQRGIIEMPRRLDLHHQDDAARTGAIFSHLAARLQNPEFSRAVDSVNDRLYAMRLLDERVLGRTAEELSALETIMASGAPSSAVKQVKQFHRRRGDRLATYVRLLRAPSVPPPA